MGPQKTNFQTSLNDGRKEIDKHIGELSSVSEQQYNTIKAKGKVKFNRRNYYGAFSQYKSLVEREKISSVFENESFLGSLKDLAGSRSVALRDFDWLVYGVHGRANFLTKRERYLIGGKVMTETKVLKFVTVDYSEGTKRQPDVLSRVEQTMRGTNAHTMILSCYQTWRGQTDFQNYKEWGYIISPKGEIIKAEDGKPCEISFVPYSAKKTIGRQL